VAVPSPPYDLQMSTRRVAVATLIRGGAELSNYKNLLERNKMLQHHCDMSKVDSLVFYEQNTVPSEMMRYAPECTFVPIEPFRPVAGIQLRHAGAFSWGYRRMCEFWFCEFWKYVQDYDRLVRVDDDCIAQTDLVSALVAPMDGQTLVTYAAWQKDTGWVTEGLADWFNKHVETQRTVWPCGCHEPQRSQCYCGDYAGPSSQVLGLDLAGLREVPVVRRIVDELRRSNKILENRWGDLPLWGELLRREMPEHHRVAPGVGYVHRSWGDLQVRS